MMVSMIEQPKGVWWASVMQKSWYSRPLLELIQDGKPIQAMVEYLLSKVNRKWRPDLIIIDKRGVPVEEPPGGGEPPAGNPWDDVPFPWDYPLPEGWPSDFEYFDTDSDGLISPAEWPFDPLKFGIWDQDGDGFISEEEWAAAGRWPGGNGDYDFNGYENSWFRIVEFNGAEASWATSQISWNNYGSANAVRYTKTGIQYRNNSELSLATPLPSPAAFVGPSQLALVYGGAYMGSNRRRHYAWKSTAEGNFDGCLFGEGSGSVSEDNDDPPSASYLSSKAAFQADAVDDAGTNNALNYTVIVINKGVRYEFTPVFSAEEIELDPWIAGRRLFSAGNFSTIGGVP